MAILDARYLEAIKRMEGFTPQAQWDYRQNSNGYGTKALYPGEVIDRNTAEQRFNNEISAAAAHVDRIAPNAPDGVKAALTSLTYNAGPGWANSGLGDLIRSGDYLNAAQRIREYNKAGGEVLPGLQKRRAEEASWFNATSAPQQPTQMAAYPWTPGQQTQATQTQEQPAPAQPQQTAAYATPQLPSPTFEQLGKMLGLDTVPQIPIPQPPQSPLMARFGGPHLFRRA